MMLRLASPQLAMTATIQEVAKSLTLILREIQDFRQDNKKQLEDIKGEITKTNVRLDEAEARIVENEERLQNVEEVLEEMLKLQEQLQSKSADQEGCTRRENVRIYGVPEGTEDGSRAMIPFCFTRTSKYWTRRICRKRAHRGPRQVPSPGPSLLNSSVSE